MLQVNGAHDNESNTEKVPNPSTQTPCAWLVFLGNIQTGGYTLKYLQFECSSLTVVYIK